jgi:cytochrome c5
MHLWFRTLCRGALFVSLALPGSGAMAAPAGYDRDTRAYNLAHGRVVFTEHCLRCHEKGRKGAPIPDVPADWADRLDQPLPVLISHAIEGHGDMPARGETELSDQEIASAVAYVVSRARIVLGEQITALPATGAGMDEPADSQSIDDAVVQMFLLLIGKDRWK